LGFVAERGFAARCAAFALVEPLELGLAFANFFAERFAPDLAVTAVRRLGFAAVVVLLLRAVLPARADLAAALPLFDCLAINLAFRRSPATHPAAF
jgi:hypothetical protein